ncbi:hypothetical protein DFH29DRAFT_1066386 [Suillus ampliporus]|nr:hypothetical protein DFH29DRAFT_1066386 [Suillus ampliporus]
MSLYVRQQSSAIPSRQNILQKIDVWNNNNRSAFDSNRARGKMLKPLMLVLLTIWEPNYFGTVTGHSRVRDKIEIWDVHEFILPFEIASTVLRSSYMYGPKGIRTIKWLISIRRGFSSPPPLLQILATAYPLTQLTSLLLVPSFRRGPATEWWQSENRAPRTPPRAAGALDSMKFDRESSNFDEVRLSILCSKPITLIGGFNILPLERFESKANLVDTIHSESSFARLQRQALLGARTDKFRIIVIPHSLTRGNGRTSLADIQGHNSVIQPELQGGSRKRSELLLTFKWSLHPPINLNLPCRVPIQGHKAAQNFQMTTLH